MVANTTNYLNLYMTTTKKKILIIEDEKPMARALEGRLAREGFEAKAVFNGESGLELLQKEEFDLIILDLMMPKVNGFEVLKELQSKKVTMPIIVLSNLGQEEDEKKARALGAEEFFIKSNTPMAKIVERVIRFLK